MTFGDGHVHCDPHAANVLVRSGSNGKPQLVLLDHGLYRELDDTFRLEWARLWRALALADVPGIKKSAAALGVGDMYPLFAAMLTQRPWDDVANPDLDSLRRKGNGDTAMLKSYVQRYAREITVVLDRVPRQLLLLLKMSDCLRHLDRSLGGTTNTDVRDPRRKAGGLRRRRGTGRGDAASATRIVRGSRRRRGGARTDAGQAAATPWVLRGSFADRGGVAARRLHENRAWQVVTAHACADALLADDGRLGPYLRVKLRLLAYSALTAWRGGKRETSRETVEVNVPDQTSGFARDDR